MEHTYVGKVAWAHRLLEVDPKYKKYSVDFFCTDADRKAIKALGTRLTLKENDSGFFYTFGRNPDSWRSPGPPLVVDANDQPWPKDKAIGNGSTLEITIATYDWKSPTHGEGKGHYVVKAKVLEHVVYEKPNAPAAPAAQEEPPVVVPETPQPASAGKKGRPF
jgi:hypothetical protein